MPQSPERQQRDPDAGSNGEAGKGAGSSERSDAPREERRKEIGGPRAPEPTRYGDWERNGRCSDF